MDDASVQNARPVVGFVGLGSQGGPMARRIADAGFPTLLWARRPETLIAFAGGPAECVASLSDLAARADHVGVCVVDDAGTRAIVEALLPAMRPGSRIAVHATVHPKTCIELAERARESGVVLVDAPVSGGGAAAADGTLTVMVGGAAEAVAAAMPVFETFGGLVAHFGPIGSGQFAKLVNNALMAATLALADAALAAGDTLGLDRDALVRLVQASSGRSYAFDVRARLSRPIDFAHGARLLAKDVCLLADVLDGNPAATRLRDAAAPFLDPALETGP